MGKQNAAIHTTGCSSALERKEILAPVTTQVNLEDVRLSEIEQTRKDRYIGIPLL